LIGTGCQEFFTGTLSGGFARDASDLAKNATADNVAEFAATAKSTGDTELSAALLAKMDEIIADNPDDVALKVVAVDLAIEASGVGDAFLESSADILNSMNDETLTADEQSTAVIDAVNDALAGLANLDASSDAILTYAVDAVDPSVLSVAFVAASTADQLAFAALTIVASEATSYTGGLDTLSTDLQEYSDYLNGGTDPGLDPALTAKLDLVIDLANAAKTKAVEADPTSKLAEMLANFNL